MMIRACTITALLFLSTLFVGCTPESESTDCETNADCEDSGECVNSVCSWDLDENDADAGHDTGDNDADTEHDTGDNDTDTEHDTGDNDADPEHNSGATGEENTVTGVIDGHDFEAVSASISLVDGQHYVVGIRNYSIECGGPLALPEEFTPLLVNFEILDTEPGISDVYINSGHGASFQRDLVDSESFTVEEGTLTLEYWTETTGGFVTGEIDFSTDDGEHFLSGRFEAEVCF